jgi:hypothetical protein
MAAEITELRALCKEAADVHAELLAFTRDLSGKVVLGGKVDSENLLQCIARAQSLVARAEAGRG